MFNMAQLRRWLFGLRADRSQSLVLRRPNLDSMEDRLPPGDVLLTSLFAGGLSFFDDLIPPPSPVSLALIRSVDEANQPPNSTGIGSFVVSEELPGDHRPIDAVAVSYPHTTTSDSLLLSPLGENTPSSIAGGLYSNPQSLNPHAPSGPSASASNGFNAGPALQPIQSAAASGTGIESPLIASPALRTVPVQPGAASSGSTVAANITDSDRAAPVDQATGDKSNVVDQIKATHYYLADGHAVGMTINSDRVAIGVEATNSLATVALPEELRLVRTLDSTTAVYEAPGAGGAEYEARLAATAGVAFTAPVFVIQETQSEAVLLREVIVSLKPGVAPESFFADDSRFTDYRPLLGTPDQFVATAAAGFGEAALDLTNELAADPNVAWASPNFYQDWQKFYTPNDPRFGNQWHLNNTGQGGGLFDADSDLPEAWNVNQGGSANIVVAVVDDGVPTNHPDLLNWTNPGETAGDGIDNDGNGWVDDINGWNFVNNDSNAAPHVGDAHGTSVSGVASARGDNGQGVTGAAYKSPVMSVRIFDAGIATSDANIASALYYAGGRKANGSGTWMAADVVNNSWGGGADSTAINGALSWGTTSGRQGKGATYFFATGNGFAPSVSQPAAQSLNIPGVIAIGATNNRGTRSDYSNYGTATDFVAPSNDTRAGYLAIDTTDRIGADGYDPGDYTGTGANGFGGTSSATPLAAGIGALVLAQADVLGITLSPAQLRGLLRNSTDLIGGVTYDITTGKNLEYGTGRLNAFTAVSGVGKPELSVLSATAELSSGTGTTSFGSVVVGSSSDVTFRIRNQGTVPLNLSNLSVASGPFTILSGFGASTLNVGEATTFIGRFTPISGGQAGGSIIFSSNDANEGTFTLNLTGTGLVPSVSGTVYEDWNGNGTRDANDPGVANRTVYLDLNGNGLPDTTVVRTNNTPVMILDSDTITSSMAISGISGSITDLNVRLNIAHTFVSDLDVFLVAPDGTRVELFTDVGGGGANFTDTVLDNEASTSIASGSAPFTGSFRPEGSLAALYGMAANGAWTLEITDDTPVDVGTLINWQLTINTDTTEPSTTTNANGVYGFLGLEPGSYPVRAAVPAGWVATGPSGGNYTVTISGPNDTMTGRDFGTARNNRFYGSVWDDRNANGIVDSGEPPVAGRLAFLDLNGNGTLDAASNPFSNNIPTSILDTATVTSAITVSGITRPITDVNVRVRITHTFDSDLDVFLIAPDGTRVELFTDVGGGGANFTDTVLDDEAATSITSGSAPFTGSFRPEGSLAALDGMGANGTWTLEITDDLGGDTGTLNNWQLTIASAEPSVVSAANGNVVLDLPNGANVIRLTPQAGLKFTSPANGIHTVTAAGAPLYDQRFGVAEAVAPTVANVAISPSGAQRSRVSSLTVTFSERVVLPSTPALAFTLTRAGGDTVSLNASVDNTGPATVVTLTFADNAAFGSLNDGNYTLTVLAAQVQDVAQNQLGSNATHTFHRLFGDVNGDRTVDGTDFAAFGNTFGLSVGDAGFLLGFDYDANNTIDGSDFGEFGNRFGTSI